MYVFPIFSFAGMGLFILCFLGYRFMPEDHLELKRLLEGIKGKFILSYNSCGYIRKLYGDYNIVEVERAHSLIHRNTKPRYQELIIKNY